MAKRKSAPVLGPIENHYLAVASTLPHYGRFIPAGAASFVTRVGALKLLEQYPELYKIEPKRDGRTLEELIARVLEDYIAYLVGRWIRAWGKYQFPKEKYDALNEAQAQKLIVTAMQLYANEIRARDPEFLPPPPGEEELYVLRCTVEYLPGGMDWHWHQPGSALQRNQAARYWPSKELTRRQIEALRAEHDFARWTPDAIEQFLIQLILDGEAERTAKNPVKVLPLEERERERFRIVAAILQAGSPGQISMQDTHDSGGAQGRPKTGMS